MIDYSDNLFILLRIKGSAVPVALVSSLPAAILAILLCHMDEWDPEIRKESGIYDITESQLWNAMTAVIAILLGFRIRQALGRFWEGTSLLHQMRGEWFDAASCLVSFSRDAKLNKNKSLEVSEFRHTLVRLISLMHGSALDEISDNEADKYEVLDIHGLDVDTLRFLRDCHRKYNFNRVEALQHMIQVLVTHNHHTGVITIPAPILSRVYQTLSRGLVNLLNAKKIKDTMFPFPFAQIIRILLIWHSIFTPILMSQIVSNKACAAILSFLPIFGMFCLNGISSELEMPFGSDTNDLPLHHFQEEMNQALLMLVHDFADHLPHTCKRAVINFEALANYTRKTLVSKTGKAHSDSKSFLRKDFFDSDDEKDSSIARFSTKSSASGFAQALDFGRADQEPKLAVPTMPPPPPAEAEVHKPPPTLPFQEKAMSSRSTLSETSDICAVLDGIQSGLQEDDLASTLMKEAKRAEMPVVEHIGRPSSTADAVTASSSGLGNSARGLWEQLMFAHCCKTNNQERSVEISAGTASSVEQPRTNDWLKPAQLSAFFETWMRKTDLLIQEIRINSARLDASTKAMGQTPGSPVTPPSGIGARGAIAFRESVAEAFNTSPR